MTPEPAISFPYAYRKIMRWSSPSHLWIELHRLIEAYARTAGTPFSEVFAELEERFGFARGERSRWPDVETMRAAATLLGERRGDLLRRRRGWIAARRQAKAHRRAGLSGAVAPPAPELLLHEARCRAHSAAIPRVGCWGWRARRQRQSDGPSAPS